MGHLQSRTHGALAAVPVLFGVRAPKVDNRLDPAAFDHRFQAVTRHLSGAVKAARLDNLQVIEKVRTCPQGKG